MRNEQGEKESKQISKLLDLYDNCTDIFNALNLSYEKISNMPGKEYEKIYSLMEMIKAKRIKRLRKKLKDNKTITIEIIQYSKAPQKFLIEYNEFVDKSGIPTKWEYFITKGE